MKKLLVLMLVLLLCAAPALAEEPADLFALFSSSEHFTSVSERVYNIRPGNMVTRTAQGGCSDGKYHYQGFIHKDMTSNEINNTCVITKTDLATGEHVAHSEYLRLNHCNDITYNSKTNQLIVSHCLPDKRSSFVSILDPETLTILETRELDVGIYCIEYNAKRDKYVVGIFGGQDFRFLNGDLTLADDVVYPATTKTAQCITQGVGANDDVICFALFRPNMIAVYDWEGNFLCTIDTDLQYEPENLTIVDSQIYVSCLMNGNRAVLYRITPTPAQ